MFDDRASTWTIMFALLCFLVGSVRSNEECTSYCDVYNRWRPGFQCNSLGGGPAYCCGTKSQRMCCTDASKSIAGKYPPVSTCLTTAWWSFHWRILVGTLVGMLTVFLVALCVYYICVGSSKRRIRRQRSLRAPRGRGRENLGMASVSCELPPPIVGSSDMPYGNYFGPGMMMPPPYETMAKGPPSYSEAVGENIDTPQNDSPTTNTSTLPQSEAVLVSDRTEPNTAVAMEIPSQGHDAEVTFISNQSTQTLITGRAETQTPLNSTLTSPATCSSSSKRVSKSERSKNNVTPTPAAVVNSRQTDNARTSSSKELNTDPSGSVTISNDQTSAKSQDRSE